METLMEIKKSQNENVLIFEFNWELDETNADKTFTSINEEIWDFWDKKVVFNFAWLKYLNSKSIGYIADIFSNLEDNEGDMVICNCDDWVKDILDLVWITELVKTFDSLEDAVSGIS